MRFLFILMLVFSTKAASSSTTAEDVRAHLTQRLTDQGTILEITASNETRVCTLLGAAFGSFGDEVQRFDFQLKSTNGSTENMAVCIESNKRGQSSWEIYPISVLAE